MPKDQQHPKVVAHRGGKGHGRENDAETIRKVLKYKPDVIEVDVRKSKDGVLYCYHGSIPLGIALAAFLYHFNFTWIQHLIGRRDTLENILAVIPDKIIVLLDLKDRRITGHELQPLIEERERVWVMTSSRRQVRILRATFSKDVEYILNKPLFFIRYVLPMVLGFTNTMQLSVGGQREKLLAYEDFSKTRYLS